MCENRQNYQGGKNVQISVINWEEINQHNIFFLKRDITRYKVPREMVLLCWLSDEHRWQHYKAEETILNENSNPRPLTCDILSFKIKLSLLTMYTFYLINRGEKKRNSPSAESLHVCAPFPSSPWLNQSPADPT